VFFRIKKELEDFSAKLDVKDINFIPISALEGDNVVERSEKMKWYEGQTLMYLLENVHISGDHNHIDVRFPVQYVVRPMTTEHHDFRGFAGRVASGVIRKGDEISVLPSGFTSKIKSIETMTGALEEAFAPMSVCITLEDEIDISRGDMIVRRNNIPEQTQDVEAMVCWFHEKPMQANGKYALKHTSRDARCMVKDIVYKMDINTLHRNEEDKTIKMNDIARIRLRTTNALFTDKYYRNRVTGSFILIDEGTNETVGAGMII
jgi:sulfate adenylyltransferase subunit 1